MANASFRDSMNSLGWSRRADSPVNTSQQTGLLSSIQSLNPFGERGYVRLPTTEGAGAPLPARSRREEDEAWFARKLICDPCVIVVSSALLVMNIHGLPCLNPILWPLGLRSVVT